MSKKIKIKNGDGKLVELEVTDELYNLVVYDEYKDVMREKYRDEHLRDLTEASVLENQLSYSVNNLHEILEDKELMEKVNAVLDKCTEKQRRRFEMYFFEQLTFREIAKLENVVYTKIYKSIKQVRAKFKNFFNA